MGTAAHGQRHFDRHAAGAGARGIRSGRATAATATSSAAADRSCRPDARPRREWVGCLQLMLLLWLLRQYPDAHPRSSTGVVREARPCETHLHVLHVRLGGVRQQLGLVRGILGTGHRGQLRGHTQQSTQRQPKSALC